MHFSDPVQARSPIVVGKITAVFGVKGWVKVHSFTEPASNIFSYKPLLLQGKNGWEVLDITGFRPHGQGWVAHVRDVDNRDSAAILCQRMLGVYREQLPVLEQGEYYWSDLQGLEVFSCFEKSTPPLRLGRVKELLETGANDVLVVVDDKAAASSNKDEVKAGEIRERLIPFIQDSVIRAVDLETGSITVDWDPEF
ncbi:MAG: ribosome maturation factor RimM [Pseudomonadales bacterium]|nr:ribosome maturation factor RimM [Pseudomonadales bacterium]